MYNDNIISVAACSSTDSIWEKSNYNKTSVDLFAPCKNIKSTVPGSVDESGYITWSGTSMATAFVSGAAAVAKLDNVTDRCQYAVDIDDDGKLSGTEARAFMRVAAGRADETITIQELCGYYIDQVGIVLKSEYSLCPSKVYEPEYFSDMIERTYNSAYITPDTKEYFADDFQQIITLYLKEPSCDNVKKAMKEIKDKNLIDVDIVEIIGFGYIYPA